MNKEEVLLQRIEELRSVMTDLVNEKGYTNDETVEVSQQLDYFINCYNTLQHPKKDN